MIVTSLEMTSPDQLVPGRLPAERLDVAEVTATDAAVVGSTYRRIGAPYGWVGRTSWSDRQWEAELSRPRVRTWVARIGADIAGMLELDTDTEGNVGIVVFGLVPEFIGHGLGGAFLTMAIRLAWSLGSLDGGPTRRVWVETSSDDHPNALANYEGRGFRVFRTEHR